MLARLRGMTQSIKPPESKPETPAPVTPAPAAETPVPEAVPAEEAVPLAQPVKESEPIPVATPVDESETATEEAIPLAQPVEEEQAEPAGSLADLVEGPEPELMETEAEETPEIEAEPVAPAQPAVVGTCSLCGAQRRSDETFCGDCGFMFPPEPAASAVPVAAAVAPEPTMIKGRYELHEKLGERAGVTRFRALDRGHSGTDTTPVIVVRAARPEAPTLPVAEAVPLAEAADDEVLPSFDTIPEGQPLTEPLPARPVWPGLAWEKTTLEAANHPAFPEIHDQFVEDRFEYLVEEAPQGRLLWDAWDDPDATAEERYDWLRQLAEALRSLHEAGAILEGLRPDIVCVTDDGRARLTDVADLLPLPVPTDAPIRASLYTAPEVAAGSGKVDARADLYSFGAMLYALHVGRELTETDFDRSGTPKAFLPRFPDAHPLFARLLMKTFAREVAARFPSDEAGREDATGFTELIRTLDVCRRTMDNVRLEIAAWTTTGMVRTGNEDGFALLHAAEARQDDLGEAALVLLCDGMGGYEGGEVAAAMAIQVLRNNLLQQKPFAQLAGHSSFSETSFGPDSTITPVFDVELCKKHLRDALREANKQVYLAARSGKGKRGMGCTAEAVFVNGRYVVAGHVGDSRTYHLHEGRLIQLTRDQTLVNRLVELGRLTPEEAAHHPQRNELSQAVGGYAEVEPAVYHGVMRPGDWVLVCSDGLTNHIDANSLKEMLQSEAASAEMAARRLVNLANLEGATDNATVVVIRAT